MFEFLTGFLVQSGVPSPSDIEGKVILTTLLERNKYAAIVIDIGLVAIPTILGGAAAAIIGKTSYSAAKEAIRSTKEALLFLSAGGFKSLGQGPTKPTGPATEKSPSPPDEPPLPFEPPPGYETHRLGEFRISVFKKQREELKSKEQSHSELIL